MLLLKTVLPLLLTTIFNQLSTTPFASGADDEFNVCSLVIVDSSIYQPYSGKRIVDDSRSPSHTIVSIAYVANQTTWCQIQDCTCLVQDRRLSKSNGYNYNATCETLTKIQTTIVCKCADGYEQNKFNVCVAIDHREVDPIIVLGHEPPQGIEPPINNNNNNNNNNNSLLIGMIILGILLLLLLILLIILLICCCRRRKRKDAEKGVGKDVEGSWKIGEGGKSTPSNDYSSLGGGAKISEPSEVKIGKGDSDYDVLKGDGDVKVVMSGGRGGSGENEYGKIMGDGGKSGEKSTVVVVGGGEGKELNGNIYSEDPAFVANNGSSKDCNTTDSDSSNNYYKKVDVVKVDDGDDGGEADNIYSEIKM